MSEQRYMVPEGMMKAAIDGLGVEIIQARRQYVEDALHAAILWQETELAKLVQVDPYINDRFYRSESMNENAVRTGYNKAIGDIRRMYLVPITDVGVVLQMMLDNVDRVNIPIPTEVDPRRVPVLKEEAKQYIRKAIKIYERKKATK